MHDTAFLIRIESLAYGGQGVGRREDGKVVFIPQVIPGEIVRVRTSTEHASYCEATLVEIVQCAPCRVAPPCRLFDACGGCDWQHIPYPQQLTYKNDLLIQTFQRFLPEIASLMPPPEASPQVFAYRCHARLRYRHVPVPLVGFYKKNTHSVMACEQCPVLNPRSQAALKHLNDFIPKHPLPGVESLEIYAPQDEVLLLAHTETRRSIGNHEVLRKLAEHLNASGCVLVNDHTRHIQPILCKDLFTYLIDIPGKTLRLSGQLGGFIQANPEMNALMVRHVMQLAHRARRVLDLYGGCGNFGLPLAHTVETVVSVERDPRLGVLGSHNAALNQLQNIRFIDQDVREALQDQKIGWFDTIILDPPREGAKMVVPMLPGLKPERIIYVSCNPATLARDIKNLLNSGYRLTSLKLFDMFPQTYHIEAIALLEPL